MIRDELLQILNDEEDATFTLAQMDDQYQLIELRRTGQIYHSSLCSEDEIRGFLRGFCVGRLYRTYRAPERPYIPPRVDYSEMKKMELPWDH